MEKEKIIVARNCEPEGSPSEYLGAEVSMGLLTVEKITELKSMLQNDKLFEDNQVRILVDKKSLLYLVGTILEYSGGLNGKGFVFNNPNAQRTCGCGESFSL